ncbi:hypothetical protein [Archaeoglobus neptunius]|uniref:hypothetical protein n=1 Tax=Archaeoglobus neptunius TaxID=2798580 RepID=UPI001926BACC|nr:hypothetical protein [Archaeoglobus neptunius]
MRLCTAVKGHYSHRVPVLGELDAIKPSAAKIKSHYEPAEVYIYMSGCAKINLKFETWSKCSGLALPMHTGYVWGFWFDGYREKVTLKEGVEQLYSCMHGRLSSLSLKTLNS